MFRNYFKATLRNLWKNKAYSFLNIFGLAIGITCAALIFLWAEDEMTYDNTNLKKDRLYSIQVNMHYDNRLFTMGSTPRLLADALKTEVPGIVNASRVSDENIRFLFNTGDKSMYAEGKYADSSMFSLFTLPFVQGNPTNAFAQINSVVITEKTAKKFFGDEKNVIGKTIRIDNKQDFLVSGVLKDLPQNSTLQFEWLIPFENDPYYTQSLSWGSYGPFTYVELAKNANPATINKQLKDFFKQKESSQTTEAFLFPMTDWRLYNEFANGKATGSGRIKQVHLLSAIAWIILFIACINFMNLATANSQKRAKEVGVRKVLGAGKNKLVIQFFGEAVFLSFLSTILAIFLISVSLPAFNTLMDKQLSLQLNNPAHITALLTITLICGLVAGSYPSVYLSSFNPVFVLKGIKLKTGNAAFIRKGLVVLQFTVSVVFIISTIVVYQQIQHVKNRNLGFNKNNLVEIDAQHPVSSIFPLIKQDLIRTGVIENAATSDHATIYGGNSDGRFKWEGKPADSDGGITFRNVSAEFMATSGMKIIDGRDFRINDPSEINKVIITKSLSDIISKESAIGKIIQSPRGNDDGVFTNMTVVGVVEDYMYGNMYGKPGPVLFFCKPSEDANLLYVRIKERSNAEQVLSKIEAVMKKHNPAYPLQYRFVDDQFNQLFFNETQTSKVSGIFASLAIIISCLGLFGLAAYTAERRTKEIGIRKVLGASVAGVAGLLSKEFVKLVLISCVIAFPAAWWIMNDWLQSYEYRIAISWWIFIAAGAVALLIAFATVSFQAIKAAMANPVKSIRIE